MIDAARLGVDEITGRERSVIDNQDAVEKMQFFGARVRVSGIIGSGIKPNQQAHALVCRVVRQYLDLNSRGCFLPI